MELLMDLMAAVLPGYPSQSKRRQDMLHVDIIVSSSFRKVGDYLLLTDSSKVEQA
jgi:hypothetical protein